jgi:hypothetical protein
MDRPIRREHRWDTGAIITSLPDSLMVPPSPGLLRPNTGDELRLQLLGIQACRGGSEDAERFVRSLRWFAEREISAGKPVAGAGEDSRERPAPGVRSG